MFDLFDKVVSFDYYAIFAILKMESFSESKYKLCGFHPKMLLLLYFVVLVEMLKTPSMFFTLYVILLNLNFLISTYHKKTINDGLQCFGEIKPLVSSLLANAFVKITNCSMRMEDPKLHNKLVGLATNQAMYKDIRWICSHCFYEIVRF